MTDFPAFFKALWRSEKWPEPEPFPWQTMLADRASGGNWPRAINLPTASGKTACIDAAIFALAATAHQAPEKRMPRRIWFVVDRRIAVDEAFSRARKIAAKLRDAYGGPLKEVADALRGYGGTDWPLRVARLRGGAWRDDSWARMPGQPAVICSTVDQVGSSLLFRAYGHSDETASIFAALVSQDSLILLDEAHCAVPFMQTLSAVSRFRGECWAEQPVRTPFHYCIMSATPPIEVLPQDTFPDPEERARALDHPTLQRRLTARKITTLVPPVEDLVAEASSCATDYAINGGKRRVCVMVNRVDTACNITARLREEAKERADVVLLTGRMRPLDRDALIDKWKGRLKAGSTETLERPVIVVTTQCLEVGADYSFDALVTECASLDALRQRFGRLDRLGEMGESRAVILIQKHDARDPKGNPDPIYGRAIYETWTWLTETEHSDVDFGFTALDTRVHELREHDIARFQKLLAPSADAPVLLPAHLDLLCQTAPRPTPEPDVALFLHGKDRRSSDVRVVFRTDLADEDDWIETLSLLPPASPEMLTLPLSRLSRWLRREVAEDAGGDVEGALDDEDGRPGSAGVRFVIWRGREHSEVTDKIARIRPNDIVILRLTEEGVEALGQPVEEPLGLGLGRLDLAEIAAAQARGQVLLRVQSDVLAPFCDHPSVADLVDLATAEPEPEEVVSGLEAVLADDAATPFLADRLKKIMKVLRDLGEGGIRLERHPSGGLIVMGNDRRRVFEDQTEDEPFADADDLTSVSSEPVPLMRHSGNVLAVARDFVARCGMSEYAAAIEAAAMAHDLGKLDWRFQLLLRNGDEVEVASGEALAKSARLPDRRRKRVEIRDDAHLPPGFRHEFLSLQLAEHLGLTPADNAGRDLTLHLVASHHGYARPFAPVVPDSMSGDVDLRRVGIDAIASAAERQGWTPGYRMDSGVSDRFWRLTRRFGWWGLAFLESILRLSDWHASRNPVPDSIDHVRFRPTTLLAPSGATHRINFDAVDGANPLGFLAALGALRLLTSSLPDHDLRLSWEQRLGAWRPVLWASRPLDEMTITNVLARSGLDFSAMFSQELLDESESAGPKNKKGEFAWKDKLLFPIDYFRSFCASASALPSRQNEFAAAWAGETVPLGDEMLPLARRTRFDFTAGQQAFIAMLRELREICGPEELRCALFTGWRYSTAGVSMRWDTLDEKRQYALQAVDPTNNAKNPPVADPGANFLAVEALPLFPLTPNRWGSQPGFDREGRAWNWPIWEYPLRLDTIRSLLALRVDTVDQWPSKHRHALGVVAVFESRIVQPSGRYRCFTPARTI